MINYNVERINNFIGYGPLKAKYNFFAIEENAGVDNPNLTDEKSDDTRIQNILINKSNNSPYSITTEELIDQMKSYSMDWLERFKINATKNKLYSCITELYNHFNPDRKISNFEIGYSYCDLLFGNFYPIGKHSTSSVKYPALMKNIYRVDNLNEFNEFYRNKREDIFSQFILNNIINSESENYFFTFGYKQINYYHFFNKLFRNELEEQGLQEIPNCKFGLKSRNTDKYYYVKIKNTKIFCFYHTGNGWLSINQIRRLLDKL